jgi:hypothetical protein
VNSVSRGRVCEFGLARKSSCIRSPDLCSCTREIFPAPADRRIGCHGEDTASAGLAWGGGGGGLMNRRARGRASPIGGAIPRASAGRARRLREGRSCHRSLFTLGIANSCMQQRRRRSNAHLCRCLSTFLVSPLLVSSCCGYPLGFLKGFRLGFRCFSCCKQ